MKREMFLFIFITGLLFYSNAKADILKNLFCYPNPFSPFTNNGKLYIQYQLEKNVDLRIVIYTLTGDVVYSKSYEKGIENITRAGQGTYQIEWDGKNNDGRYVADGGYILQIIANDGNVIIKKFVKILIIKDR